MPSKVKPYRIKYAYDSETTNFIEENGLRTAFPILHQLGELDTPIDNVNADNVEDHVSMYLYRHSHELYAKLDEICNIECEYIPVMVCHNLSFDMYALAPWLNAQDDVRVLAKSRQKPITFTVRVDGSVRLVIWDTLVFAQKSLTTMGLESGYLKANGDWDYDLVRTPCTPLTDDEVNYATRDIYALFAWLGHWVSRNPDIDSDKLGLNVVTKTGVVRQRRKTRFSNIRYAPGKRCIGDFHHWLAKWECPKTDDELFTMQACTRGGFTFCSSSNASIPYDLESGWHVIGYDATSQHPGEMCSHLYPVKFHETEKEILQMALQIIDKVTFDDLLSNWHKPFHIAFLACIEVDNLRPKDGSIYERWGILPLASARLKRPVFDEDTDNENGEIEREYRFEHDYSDMADNARCEFGKLVSADKVRLFVTELGYFELRECYDFDKVTAISGYITGRFVKPSDLSLVSVMQFYKAKDAFKHARGEYYKSKTISNAEELSKLGIPSYLVHGMVNGTATENDIELQYLSTKADLNSLFGIEACSEFRQDTIIGEDGIEYEGEPGIQNKPKNPKAWYQFGQRIVGWSRISQLLILHLASEHVETCINGDTDSLKFLVRDESVNALEESLSVYADAFDKAKTLVCSRVQKRYPKYFDELEGIGHYVREFSVSQYCASWNKAYCMIEDGKCKFTIAGIPKRGKVDEFADYYLRNGHAFTDVCNLMLGYNVTYAHSMIGLNARAFPQWGEVKLRYVTDYQGNTSLVAEPSMICLYPSTKTVNDTLNSENAVNEQIALSNNANVNTEACIICATDDGFKVERPFA